jgi:hypothetical protein
LIEGHGAGPFFRQQIAFMHICGKVVCSIGVLFIGVYGTLDLKWSGIGEIKTPQKRERRILLWLIPKSS